MPEKKTNICIECANHCSRRSLRCTKCSHRRHIKDHPHVLEKMLAWHKTDESRKVKSHLTKAYFSNPANKERVALHNKKTNDARNPRRGERSHFWKGGISTENQILRNSVAYSEWRKKVFERDNFTCQHCGANGDLTAHHIKEWSKHRELRFDISNGLTLCIPCHTLVHKNPLHKKVYSYVCPNCSGVKKGKNSKYCRKCFRRFSNGKPTKRIKLHRFVFHTSCQLSLKF